MNKTKTEKKQGLSRVLRMSVALALGLVALAAGLFSHVLLTVKDIPISEELFSRFLLDDEVVAAGAARYTKDKVEANLVVALFRTQIPKLIHNTILPAWKAFLEGESAIFDFRIPVGALVKGLPESRVITALSNRIPEGMQLGQLLDLRSRDRKLLERGRVWYRRLEKAVVPLLVICFVLLVAAFFVTPGWERLPVPLLFVLTVVSLTIVLFLLLFRGQIQGLAGAALIQLSRNTAFERVLLREALEMGIGRFFWFYLVIAIVSFASLVGFRFWCARKAVFSK